MTDETQLVNNAAQRIVQPPSAAAIDAAIEQHATSVPEHTLEELTERLHALELRVESVEKDVESKFEEVVTKVKHALSLFLHPSQWKKL